ncbi:FixH family protein [Spirosoma gilvum]
MNWGKSIVLVFVLFASFIGTLVYRMSREHIDLVSENYYQNELDYQHQIDRENNARQNTAAVITNQLDQQQVVCELPNTLQKGQLVFYRPGDRTQDFKVTIPANHETQQVVSTAALARGRWRVQFTWSDGTREYYQESPINL